MKKIIVLFLLLFICIETIAFDFSSISASGQVLFYNINNNTNTVSVTAPVHTKVKSSYIGYAKPSGNLIIPNVVTNNGTTYIVTAIDNSAFANCTDIESVVISDSIRIIGNEAFYNCNKLKTVKLGSNVKKIGASAFLSCSKLKEITFHNNITEISKHAFSNCSSLEEISIPEKIANIEPYTFYSCENLKKITLSSSLQTIGESAFAFCRELDSVTLPESLKIIEAKAFSSCTNLKKINLPESLTSIGALAFSSCTALTSVVLPKTLKEVSNALFSHCKSLENIQLPAELRAIDNNAFEHCTKLKNIKLPNTISVIGNAVFSNCISLDSVNLPVSVSSIGRYAFQNCTNLKTINLQSVQSIEKYAFERCKNLANIDLSNVKEIREYAFSECTKLKTIALSNTMDTIRNYTFYQCSNLENVKIGDNIKTIGNYAFYRCVKLDSVILPNSLTTIGIGAFEKCEKISTITFGANVTTISNYAFNNCKNLKNITFESSIPPKVFAKTWGNNSKHLTVSIPLENDSTYLAEIKLKENIFKVKKEKINSAENLIKVKKDTTQYAERLNIALNKINTIDIRLEQGIEMSENLKGLSKIPQKRKLTYLDYPQSINTMTLSLSEIETQPIQFTNLSVEIQTPVLAIEQVVAEPIKEIVAQEPEQVKKNVKLTVFSENTTMGKVVGEGKFNKGTEVNISAVANKGYRFVSWHDNNIDNPRNITLKADTAFCAIFEPETYILDVNTNDIIMGDAYGSGIYDYNSEVIITADAFDGYQFVKWNDGSIENPRKIKVNETEKIYIAIFAPKNNFEVNEKLTYYPNPTKGVVYLSKKAKMIEIFNTSGNLLEIFTEKSVVDISSLPAGTYTFRVTINEGIQTLKVVLKK